MDNKKSCQIGSMIFRINLANTFDEVSSKIKPHFEVNGLHIPLNSSKLLFSIHTLTVWPDPWIICWIFGHLEQLKCAQIFAKVGSQSCQILNSWLRNGQRLFKILPKWPNFTKSGHTTP